MRDIGKFTETTQVAYDMGPDTKLDEILKKFIKNWKLNQYSSNFGRLFLEL